MKKLIYLMSLILLISALQQCKTSDSLLDDQDHIITNNIHQNKVSDTINQSGFYPDPPIKDGHDWKTDY